MKKIKLITQLKTLEKDEIIALGKYLHSPFFNTNPHICNLYNYLVDFYPSFEGMDRVAMLAKTFPNQEVDSKALSTLMWQFCKVMEDFLIYSELKKDSVKRSILLKDNYRRRNLTSDFENTLLSLLETTEKRNSNSFESKVQRLGLLNEQLFEVSRSVYQELNTTESALSEFEECLDFVHSYGQINIPWLLPYLDSEKFDKPLRLNYNSLNAEYIEMQKSIGKINPMLGIMSLLLKIHREKRFDQDSLTDLDLACKKFIRLGHTLNFMEQRKIFILINNTANRFSTLKTKAFKIAFRSVKYAADNKIIGRKGFFNENTLNNVITIGGAVGEYEFVKGFINDNYQLLPVKDQENERLLALSNFFFRIGEYEDTIFHLKQAYLTNPFRKCIFKSVLVRSHYELFEENEDRYDLLHASVRSFDRLLKRSVKIEEQERISQRNFLIVLKKLIIRRKNKHTSQRQLSNLQELLDSFDPIHSYEWLKRKIGNLKK